MSAFCCIVLRFKTDIQQLELVGNINKWLVCNISMYLRLTDAVMTNLMLSLLLLYSHGNWHSSPDHVVGATADDQHVESVAPSSAKRSRSSCQPLGSFVSCYDVVDVPAFVEVFAHATSYRQVELPVIMGALGRNFSLRLRFDPLTGDSGGLMPEMAWSSVLSPSSVVNVMGEGGNVSTYSQDGLKISWYIGIDAFEVAPSSVLASVIDFNGVQLFRAVIHTTSDIYYVEPALRYPEVERTYRPCFGHASYVHVL